MHEASIALSVLDTVVEQCSREGYGAVELVRLKIGKAAGILPDALQFAFDAAKIGTIADEAVLDIEIIRLGGCCRDCGSRFESDEKFVFNCPGCGSSAIEMNMGFEMQIVDMEVR